MKLATPRSGYCNASRREPRAENTLEPKKAFDCPSTDLGQPLVALLNRSISINSDPRGPLVVHALPFERLPELVLKDLPIGEKPIEQGLVLLGIALVDVDLGANAVAERKT